MYDKYKCLIGLRYTIGDYVSPHIDISYRIEDISEKNVVTISWLDYVNNERISGICELDILVNNINNNNWFIVKSDLRKIKLKNIRNG